MATCSYCTACKRPLSWPESKSMYARIYNRGMNPRLIMPLCGKCFTAKFGRAKRGQAINYAMRIANAAKEET